MKRSFSVFILSAFFVYSIIATSRNPDLMPPRPTQPFPQIASVSSENLVLPLVSVTISEAK